MLHAGASVEDAAAHAQRLKPRLLPGETWADKHEADRQAARDGYNPAP